MYSAKYINIFYFIIQTQVKAVKKRQLNDKEAEKERPTELLTPIHCYRKTSM